MHGIKRTRISPQAAEAKRLKELAKIEAYTALQTDVLARKKTGEYTVEALGQTTELLDLNPEFYTIWNYRRHILLRGLFPGASPEDIVARLTSELRLTTAYLQIHPKVYWIWNHRKWCLENVPLGPAPGAAEASAGSAEGAEQAESSGAGVTSEASASASVSASASASASTSHPKTGREGWRNEFWKMELGLIEKMLDADARNFHAWDYRRYVLRSLPHSFSPPHRPSDELRYTQKKIEANFSNFSAWHCRTKVLGGMWEGMAVEEVARQKDQEFELVTQALWTDPGDQSGWLYHRWLVGSSPEEAVLRREIGSIRELHETEPDSKWCMNALAHYALLLARSPTTQADELAKLRTEAKALYSRLETVDSDRAQRYRDMVARC
ncbi:hypothetical protein JCM24511_08345 [Saitozyma sp. JCM 24511]|nr:hypothetical protein JCM24511_08345 [Saitozyma sp. JCM 24511]